MWTGSSGASAALPSHGASLFAADEKNLQKLAEQPPKAPPAAPGGVDNNEASSSASNAAAAPPAAVPAWHKWAAKSSQSPSPAAAAQPATPATELPRPPTVASARTLPNPHGDAGSPRRDSASQQIARTLELGGGAASMAAAADPAWWPTACAALTEFDNQIIFGPRAGGTRMQRWRRAERLLLNPPPEIFAFLTQIADLEPTRCVGCPRALLACKLALLTCALSRHLLPDSADSMVATRNVLQMRPAGSK